jgi:hypothetical protein
LRASPDSKVARVGFRVPEHRAPIRLLNGSWRALKRVGIGRTSLAEDSIVRAARKRAGSEDLGEDWESEPTREARRRLLSALEGEACLHPMGRAIMRGTLIRAVENRLRMEDLWKKHPEIGANPVASPVFIAGLPRTGTTMLHRLLTCEPSHRPLLSWEALNPAPLSDPTRAEDDRRSSSASTRRGGLEPRERDPRMRLAEIAERALRIMAPEFFAIHPVEAHDVEEDVLLQDGSFVSPTVDATMPVPGYSAWLHSTDQTHAYRYVRRLIQLLLWQRPGTYLGKTPHHLENLETLLAVFPGARVIHTHRDPLKVVASFSSMMAHGRRVFSDDVDPLAVGRQLHHKSLDGVTRAMASREKLPASSFIDVHYQDLLADPMKEIRRIYDFLGLSLSAETDRSMQEWRTGNPQNKHGMHRYHLEDFGLDREVLRRDFAPYRACFQIVEE